MVDRNLGKIQTQVRFLVVALERVASPRYVEAMNRKQKGDLAVLKVATRCVEKGWTYSVPMTVARYDLVLDDGKRLYRTQVKYTDAVPVNSTGAVMFTANNGPDAPQFYTKDEIDVIIAYVPKIDALVWIEPEYFDHKYGVYIRLEMPKNGQRKGIFLAEEHIW